MSFSYNLAPSESIVGYNLQTDKVNFQDIKVDNKTQYINKDVEESVKKYLENRYL